ncbi:4102_t:CDS:2, partial [Racocetra fulgida]
ARHIHAYSDTKDALKIGVRNVKENIKEGVKTDLVLYLFVLVINMFFFGLQCVLTYNLATLVLLEDCKRIVIHAFEHGSCPELDVMQKQLIYREGVIKKLRRVLEPISDHSSYHVVVGNHGTGKTTVVRQCARDVGKGVIYVDVPPILDNFIDNLANAIGYSFEEYVSFTDLFKRKILGKSESARKYKANNGKPPVLILNNISQLSQKNVNLLEDLQDFAKLHADQSKRSSWSRAEKNLIVIEDLTSEEAFTYLHSKLGIEKKVTNQLIQLLGSRIRDLKEYDNMAEMMEGERNHVIGKVIVQELVKNEKIHYDTFIKLVNNKQIANELLQANVFSYNPESRAVTFQSRATKAFVRE